MRSSTTRARVCCGGLTALYIEKEKCRFDKVSRRFPTGIEKSVSGPDLKPTRIWSWFQKRTAQPTLQHLESDIGRCEGHESAVAAGGHKGYFVKHAF